MAVKTTISPIGEEYDLCMVQAEGCSVFSHSWWGDGCMVVCTRCAARPEVSDAVVRAIAIKHGCGPIPEENTDIPTPRPRVVGKLTNRRPHPAGPGPNGTHIVDVTCPSCEATVTVTYGGWIALGCPCGVDIARNNRSL